LAVSDCIDGNHHDSFELVERVQNMIATLDNNTIDYSQSHINADSAFDMKTFIEFVEHHKMIANIKENKRNSKSVKKIYRYFSDYIYSFRFKVEIVFSWLDTYKRVLNRFEFLACHFKSWILLAAALINFRTVFN